MLQNSELFYFLTGKENFFCQFTKNYSYLDPKSCQSSQKYGFGIRDRGYGITINVPVVYMGRYEVVLRGDYP
jgi:hypothetical protein